MLEDLGVVEGERSYGWIVGRGWGDAAALCWAGLRSSLMSSEYLEISWSCTCYLRG